MGLRMSALCQLIIQNQWVNGLSIELSRSGTLLANNSTSG